MLLGPEYHRWYKKTPTPSGPGFNLPVAWKFQTGDLFVRANVYLDEDFMRDFQAHTAADDDLYMEMALAQARQAAADGEAPVGAVIVRQRAVIARGRNRREERQSPLADAEMLAIEAASSYLKSWRLTDCELYVTLEPCIMCA